MSIGQQLAMELEHEGANTRKVLERIPEEKFGWKPHEKSFSAGQLASHLAEISYWGSVTVSQPEFNIESGYKLWEAKTRAELLEKFDSSQKAMLDALRMADDKIWQEPWSLKQEGKVFFTMPRIAVLRSFVMNHAVHHRGQLTVYMRLLGISVPATYGPSADEQS